MIGIITLLAYPVYLSLQIPGILRVNAELQRSDVCRQHLESLCVAIIKYMNDHDKLPDADHCVDQIHPYVGNWSDFRCSSDNSTARCSYAMNRKWSNATLTQLKGEDKRERIILFETKYPGQNPSGYEDSCLIERHRQSANPNPGLGLRLYPPNELALGSYYATDTQLKFGATSPTTADSIHAGVHSIK